MISEHAICALPDDHPDWRHLVIRVRRCRATNCLELIHGGFYLTAGNHWTPDAREAVQFATERAALEAAEHWAPLVDVNGLTAADLLNRS